MSPDQAVRLDLRVDQLAQPDPLELRALRGLAVRRVLPAQAVLRELPGHQALPESPDRADPAGLRDQQVLKVSPGRAVLRVKLLRA